MRMSRRRGVSPATNQPFSMSYTGTHTVSVVTLGVNSYDQWTLTGSGTLTIKGREKTGRVWLCGGGGGGSAGGSYGGAGGYTALDNYYSLKGRIQVTIGEGGRGATALGDDQATDGGDTVFGALTARGGGRGLVGGGGIGGTGGGKANLGTAGGTGDGVSKYPYGDTVNFLDRPHCAGGGGGGYEEGPSTTVTIRRTGGAGGTNGGASPAAPTTNTASTGGAGGAYGGGAGSGATALAAGRNATYYGSGGGGGGGRSLNKTVTFTSGGNGYPGVVHIRILRE